MKQVDGTPGPRDGHEPGLFIMETLIGKTLSHYRIVEKIGAGGMGEVYRAHDSRLGRDVAIKVIPAELSRDPDRIKRFEQEARAAGALNHPNVCAIYDVGTHEGTPYVVMELLEGESLRDRIAAGPIPLRKALDYAAQVAHGLAAAHEKGIVHRDLKPANLFVTKTGRVKVLDFGLAKLTRPEIVAPVGETTESVVATETGAVLGTVGYMSPEQVRGHAADHRSDIFALGAILYELLTGKRAFHGASYVETLNAILNEDPTPLSSTGSGRAIPPSLEMIVRRCLEKAPAERFQSASDLAFDLETLSGNDSGGDSSRIRAQSRQRHPIRLIGLTIVIAILIGIAAAYLLKRDKGTIRPDDLKYTRLTFQRGQIITARFSPDGASILYSARWDGRQFEIFETRRGFPTARSIVSLPAFLLSISKTGMMAVTLAKIEGAAVPAGTRVLAVVPMTGGTPRRVLEGDVGDADWSTDGNTMLVVRSVPGGKTRLEMPPGRSFYESEKGLDGPRLSPDGRRVAVREFSPGLFDEQFSLVIMDTTGRVTARTREWPWLGSAAWSADGREVWFGCSDDAAWNLMALSLDGRERVVARFDGLGFVCDVGRNGDVLLSRVNLTQGVRARSGQSGEERELGWWDNPVVADISPDGRSLLFTEMGAFGGRSFSVCLRGMDGSEPVKLGEGKACALSPDGKWALAIQFGPPSRLVLLPTGAGSVVSIPRGGIDKYSSARWMPDGKSILFRASEAGRGERTYVQDLQGGAPRAITPEGIVVSAVSPDGKLIAFTREADRDRPEVQALFVRPLEGDSAKQVALLRSREEVVQWAAGGEGMFTCQLGDSFRVSRIDLHTGRRTPWRTIGVADPAGLGLQNLAITPDGSSYAFTYWRVLSTLYLVEGLR